MSKKTKIIIGALVLVVACGVLYSLITTDTEADCLREWVDCSYLEYNPACPGGPGNNALHKYRCHLCVGYSCPAAPDHHCVEIGWQCLAVPVDPPNQK